MELLVNSLIGLVLVFDLFRGLLEWGDKALLVGGAVAAGAYFGTRAALTPPRPHDRRLGALRCSRPSGSASSSTPSKEHSPSTTEGGAIILTSCSNEAK